LKLPVVVSETRPQPDSLELLLELPAQLDYFKGHFPQGPILPGVVQLDWARHFGLGKFPLNGTFSGMDALKFQKVLQPGERVTLRLDFLAEKKALRFSYSSGRGKHSSGLMVFNG
jgi:3-hydroxymyristoyl/3-hydroxydecanoyl-(acyl carrier protein) dehydratase